MGVQVCSGRQGSGPRAAPHPPPPPGGPATPTARARRKGVAPTAQGGTRMGYRGPPPRGGAGRPQRDLLPPPTPPPARKPRGPRPQPPEEGGMVPPPRPREERERGPPCRPSRWLPQEPRRTSEPARTRQDAAQIAPREGRRARTGVVWGVRPPMDRTTPETPALLPAQGRQEDGTRQSDPPPYRPPRPRKRGARRTPPPPPSRPPAHERH